MAFRGTFQRLNRMKQTVQIVKNDLVSASTLNDVLQRPHVTKQAVRLCCTNHSLIHCTRPVTVFTCSRRHSLPNLNANDIANGRSLSLKRYASTGTGTGDTNEKCTNPRTEVTYDELVELIEKGSILLFDVREPKEIEETGLMPGAVNIPITKLKSSLALDEEKFVETYKCPKPSGQGENVLFSGFSHVKSETALELAHKAGFKKARHFPGGWKEWSEKQSTT